MAYSETINRRYAATNRTLERAEVKTSTGKGGISESIANGASDLSIPLAIDISQVKVIYIEAVGGALTVKTNSSSTPDDTLALADSVPQMWVDSDLSTFFLTADVTGLFVSNASGSTVTLNVEFLYDATP